MSFALRHQFRSALQPLFGVDHVAAGEAIFAAPVLAEFDQVGRTANSAHRPVVLILPVGVAMHEHRKRTEEHTSELQSLMRISYAVFCLKKKKKNKTTNIACYRKQHRKDKTRN